MDYGSILLYFSLKQLENDEKIQDEKLLEWADTAVVSCNTWSKQEIGIWTEGIVQCFFTENTLK